MISQFKHSRLELRDVARSEKGRREPRGQAKGIVVFICLLQKSYMQSWWHCRIAKGEGGISG
jgi:hypothetical protein